VTVESYTNMLDTKNTGIVPDVSRSDDPFDLVNMRLTPANTVAAKKEWTTISARKPHKQDWFRVKPDEVYGVIGVLDVKSEDKSGELYLVSPAMLAETKDLGARQANLYLAMNKLGVPFIIPVKLPSEDGKSNPYLETMAQAVERAKEKWVRASANTNAGYYEIFTESDAIISNEPVWPDKTLTELVRLGFKDKIIMSPAHPVYQSLKGLS
jgi:hypothetical protein